MTVAQATHGRAMVELMDDKRDHWSLGQVLYGRTAAAARTRRHGVGVCYVAGVKAHEPDLRGEFKRLFRSMSFVSRHASLNRRDVQADRFAEIYQQLGILWEFLALQCRHTEGWRKRRDAKLACTLCGTIRGATERWVLLPRVGKKIIGRKGFPNSSETFPNKKDATIVEDAIDFHGATLNVSVHNSYRLRWFRRGKLDINIAADRIVRVEEGGIECWLDTHLAKLTLRKHKRGESPPYGAFMFELPKRVLKRFPVLVEYTARGELVGLTAFRPNPPERRRKGRKTSVV